MTARLTSTAFLLIALAGLIGRTGGTSAQSTERVDFERDIRPIFRASCYGCHSAVLQSGNFRLDRRRDSMPNRVGANGARIVPGNSAVSRLYLRVSGNEAGLQMPPTGALQAEEIRTIKTWIDQGADWPDALAGEAPSPPQDPVANELLDSLRRGDRGRVARVLKGNPKAASAAGSGGVTPLMYASLYGDAASARLLLDAGANPNALNDAGATALLWAVDDLAITRLLLERGADPNVRSADGRTALQVAVARSGARDVVAALIDRGATVKGQAVLAPAASAGDAPLMRLLLDRGADTVTLPNDLALRSGCADCAALLLQSAGRPALTRALEAVARYGDSDRMRMLLDRGAEPTPAALRTAAAAESIPRDGIVALLDRGIRDEQALDLAVRHGDTPVVAALRKAGIKESPVPALDLKRPSMPRSAREAVVVSLPRLQHADTVFLKTAGCISCHNNSLFEMTAAIARRKGFQVDEAASREQMTRVRAYLESWRERELQDIPIPGAIDTTSYILVGLAAASYPPDAATDALARYVKRRQFGDGGWRIASHRPPIESSDIEATALGLRSLQAYAPATRKAEYARAIERGAAWLTQAQPKTTEDHAFRLLGLHWAGANQTAIREAARALVALQRSDGGWSQLPTLASDAYATGQTLTALAESGALKPTDAVYEKGVRFLLTTQLEDGSWYVRSRAVPIQPYFDSEFPHGKDQFISAAATNWATMALALSAR
jgi:ankyrin repeat protein